MPTSASLVGAVFFAGLAFLTSSILIPYLPDGTQPGYMGIINTLVGAFCGWKIMGPRAKGSRIQALTGGVTTTASMVLLSLFVHGVIEMVFRSLRKRYDGAVEAVVNVFEIAWEYSRLLLQPDILGLLLVGALLGGLFAHMAAQRWP